MLLPYDEPAAPPGCCPEDLGHLSSAQITCVCPAGGEGALAVCSFPNVERLRASRLGPPKPYDFGISTVSLPPDPERIATEAGPAGRRGTESVVLAAAAILLRRHEQGHADLLAFAPKAANVL